MANTMVCSVEITKMLTTRNDKKHKMIGYRLSPQNCVMTVLLSHGPLYFARSYTFATKFHSDLVIACGRTSVT
jgi:hypothetical protein